MDGFLHTLLFQCLAVAFLNARHLVIAASVQFVVSYRRGRSVEVVQRNGFVRVFEFLNVQRIGGVVHQHIGVATQFGKVDNVVIDVLVVTLDAVIPSEAFGGRAERLNHFTRPDFGKHGGAGAPLWQDGTCKQARHVTRHRTSGRGKTRHTGERRTRRTIQGDGCNQGQNGRKQILKKFHCFGLLIGYFLGMSCPYSALYRRS